MKTKRRRCAKWNKEQVHFAYAYKHAHICYYFILYLVFNFFQSFFFLLLTAKRYKQSNWIVCLLIFVTFFPVFLSTSRRLQAMLYFLKSLFIIWNTEIWHVQCKFKRLFTVCQRSYAYELMIFWFIFVMTIFFWYYFVLLW